MNKLSLLCTCFILYNITSGQNQPEFGNQVDMGLIENSDLWEASGVVESRKNSHVFWSHNDRNHHNRLFAFNSIGKNLAVFWVDGIVNRDWEDIAIGPGPTQGIDYLYVGDIGDNEAVHDFYNIYRIPEPEVNYLQDPIETTLYGAETITYQYPDGMRDAETLMLDPITKDLYVVSKREFEDIRVYRIPYPQSTDSVIILEHLATLNLWSISGGDISPSGFEILIKDYSYIYYWSRNQGQNLWEVFNTDPIIVPYVEEVGGEAVCWASDDMGYYTLSEEWRGFDTHLYFYPRINPSTVVINEIIQNPLAVHDVMGEWFEIYNNSSETVNLNGWIIRDDDTDYHVISETLILSPGEYLVLGNNSDFNTNGGVNVDYQYDNFGLDNTTDEIVIVSDQGETIDNVAFDNGTTYPISEGTSIALRDPNMNNNFGLHWKESKVIFGDGDKGTPGLSNSAVYEMSIKDIQFTTDPSGISPFVDQKVTVSGIVTVEPRGQFVDWFFIQESVGKWSGINTEYRSTNAEKGDSIKLTGTVMEVNGGLTKIGNVYEFEILKKNVFGINPVQVTTGDIGPGGSNSEAYEGILIKTSGICDNDNLGWREWSMDDGSGSVRVYNGFWGDFVPVLGEYYEVTGIQYFRNGNFQIFPWNRSDVITTIETDHKTIRPNVFALDQNYPNPFNPITTIKYSIPKLSFVTLKIFDVLGNEVAVLFNEEKPVGNYEVGFDATNLSSGVYFYRLQVYAPGRAGEFTDTKKMVLLR